MRQARLTRDLAMRQARLTRDLDSLKGRNRERTRPREHTQKARRSSSTCLRARAPHAASWRLCEQPTVVTLPTRPLRLRLRLRSLSLLLSPAGTTAPIFSEPSACRTPSPRVELSPEHSRRRVALGKPIPRGEMWTRYSSSPDKHTHVTPPTTAPPRSPRALAARPPDSATGPSRARRTSRAA